LLFTTLLQGWFLPASGMSGTGWMIALVIVIAAIAGLVELSFYAFMYEPPLRQLTPKPGQNGLAQFLAPLKEKKFFPFLLLIFFIMASTSAVAPFLWRHFLDVVQLSPLKASLILQATPLLATFLFGRLWGRWIDRHGIKPAIAIGVSGGTLAMLCWPFISPQFWWVGLFVGFMGSVFWLAVDISFMNGLMRFTSLAGGHRYATLYNFFAASGGALAGVLAGEIAQQLVATQWVAELRSTLLTYHIQFSPYVVLILIGALIRFFAVAVVLPRLEHDKPVKSFQAVRMFHTQIYYAIAGSISMPVRMVRSRIKL
jgi:MFS family permease